MCVLFLRRFCFLLFVALSCVCVCLCVLLLLLLLFSFFISQYHTELYYVDPRQISRSLYKSESGTNKNTLSLKQLSQNAQTKNNLGVGCPSPLPVPFVFSLQQLATAHLCCFSNQSQHICVQLHQPVTAHLCCFSNQSQHICVQLQQPVTAHLCSLSSSQPQYLSRPHETPKQWVHFRGSCCVKWKMNSLPTQAFLTALKYCSTLYTETAVVLFVKIHKGSPHPTTTPPPPRPLSLSYASSR